MTPAVRKSAPSKALTASAIERLLDDAQFWQWRVSLDENGRIVYTSANGVIVPAREVVAEDLGPQVIEQVVKEPHPYPTALRPADKQGKPGGLILIEKEKRAIIVGDLHGRFDNLQHILSDKDNLRDVLSGRAHLIFTGDAIHPPSTLVEKPDAYAESFAVMLLIITLKAQNPAHVHYLLGNHDNSHCGGAPTGRGEVRQDVLFEQLIIEKFGRDAFRRYQEFVMDAPVAALIRAGKEHVICVHAGLTERVGGREGLINIFAQAGA